MKLRHFLAMAVAATALSAGAQSGIQNPITQAVLQVYEEELQANPRDYNILLSRADEYYRHGEYIRALPDVDKAIEYAPASDEDVILRAYILRAGIYNQTKRPEQALPDLEKAVKLAPDSYNALYQLANTQYTLGRYSDARLSFSKLERLNNRMPEAYIGLARIAVKENNLGTANEAAAKARASEIIGMDIDEMIGQKILWTRSGTGVVQ